MGFHLSERMVNKLDKDQHRTLWIEYYRQPEKQLMLSESGVYALLVYHYAPGNRLLREWMTHQVVPALRDAEQSDNSDRPMLSLLDWPEMSLSLLHWQDEGVDSVAGYALFTAGPAANVLVAEGFAVFSVLTGCRKKGATFCTLY